ncbi:MAG: C4-dicarboxylate ABC transporter substrate-binding protein, partial [Deltaproteobacteria bacterium]
WGANAVGMPMSATPEALEKGVVKGLFSSLEVMKDFKFAELCKYVTVTDAVVYPFAVVMNMTKWNSLPRDVQQVFEELGPQQAAWTGVYMDNHVKQAMSWSKRKQGVKVIRLSKAEKAKWDKLLEPIVNNWVKSAESKGVPGKALVRDIKAFMNMYSGQ